MKLKVEIDNVGYNSKPQNDIGAIKPRTQNQNNIKEINIKELMDLISKGHTISPGILKDGCKSENWKEQQLFMVDIDNNNSNEDIITSKQALKICEDNNLMPAFYYYTFTDTKEKPKFRLCFVLDKIITDNNERLLIMKTLNELFVQSDKSTKNSDRIFFGTNKKCILINEKNVITLENIIKVNENKLLNIDNINNTDNELERLKKTFDFYGYLVERNGEPIYSTTEYCKFKNCELCNHKDNLIYYFKTKTFMCFSESVNKGGSIIDYIQISKNMTLPQAIHYFKYELLKLPKNLKSYKNLEKNDVILNKIKDLNPIENYTLDEKGISKLFADVYIDINRFNVSVKEWYYYDGKVWKLDESSMNTNKNLEIFTDNLTIYTNNLENSQEKHELIKICRKLSEYKNRNSLLKDSKDVHFISNLDFDKNDDLLNCQNGTLNLKTLDFKNHNAKDLLTKITNVIYNPEIKSYKFEKFISEIMEHNEEKIIYLQKVLGYCLTTYTYQEELYIFLGTSTRNGKSTLIETYAYMLGNSTGYALNCSPETLAKKINKDSRTASNDVARLNNCRFLSTSELPKSMPIDIAFIKSITGNDRITARFLHQSEIEFTAKFKLVINTNYFPYIDDNTIFQSNRISIITFNRHFNEQEQNINLKNELKEVNELSGILNWCIEGLLLINKDKTITKPKCIIDDINKYKHKSDTIKKFIDESLVKSTKHSKIKEIYEVYIKWCLKKDVPIKYKHEFIEYLKNNNLYKASGTINGITERNIIPNHEIRYENYE